MSFDVGGSTKCRMSKRILNATAHWQAKPFPQPNGSDAPESQQVMRKLAMSYHELALLAEERERQPKAMDAPDPELARSIPSARRSRYRFR